MIKKSIILPILASSLILPAVFFGGGIASPALAAVACTNNAECTPAASPGAPVCSNGVCVSGGQWFQNIITNFLNIVVWPIFIAVSIIMFIWAGILFISAQGDPGKVAEARKAVIWAVIGIVVGLLGYLSVAIIKGALGL